MRDDSGIKLLLSNYSLAVDPLFIQQLQLFEIIAFFERSIIEVLSKLSRNWKNGRIR